MRPHRFSDKSGKPIEGVRPSFKMHPEQHAAAVEAAAAKGLTFTDWMLEAVDAKLKGTKGKRKR